MLGKCSANWAATLALAFLLSCGEKGGLEPSASSLLDKHCIYLLLWPVFLSWDFQELDPSTQSKARNTWGSLSTSGKKTNKEGGH